MYDDTIINPFIPWKRAGITDFLICNVFNSKLVDDCPKYDRFTPSNNKSQHFAMSTLEIAAMESIEEYQTQLIEIFKSNVFIDISTENMNDKLNNYTSNRFGRRRQLSAYNSFSAIDIQIINSSNNTIIGVKEDDGNGISSNFIVLIIVVIAVMILLIIVLIILYIFHKKRRGQPPKMAEGEMDEHASVNMVEQEYQNDHHDTEGIQQDEVMYPPGSPGIYIDDKKIQTQTSFSLDTLPNPDISDDDDDSIIQGINAMHDEYNADEEVIDGSSDTITAMIPTPGNNGDEMNNDDNNDAMKSMDMDPLDDLQPNYVHAQIK